MSVISNTLLSFRLQREGYHIKKAWSILFIWERLW